MDIADKHPGLLHGRYLILLCIVLSLFSQQSLANEPSMLDLSSISIKSSAKDPDESSYVGAEACSSCHLKEYERWRKSTHANAGGPPDTFTLIPSFDGELHFSDATVSLDRLNDDDYFFTIKMAEDNLSRFRVDAVIGAGHITTGGTQTYFSTMPDGTLRYLPFDYSVNAKTWFCQTAQGWLPIDKTLSIKQCLSWPPQQLLGEHVNFRQGCLDCHGSGIELTFVPQEGRYQTSFRSLAVDCETCHGAAGKHVTLARHNKLDSSKDSGLTDLNSLDKYASVNVCLQCHGKKTPIDASGHLSGEYFLDRYAVITSQSNTSLLPGGRVRDFSYQESHMFSGCFLRGGLTCVQCHSPHDQSYRDVTGKRLDHARDNKQCTVCHPREGSNTQAHSHHPAGSSGDYCVACHMPQFQQPGVGRFIPFERADHGITIPRPVFEARLGVGNACSQCHKNKSPMELQMVMNHWYGTLKPVHRAVQTQLIAKESRVSAERLLESKDALPPAQLANLFTFIDNYIDPDMKEVPNNWIDLLKTLSSETDIDLKSAALMALHLSYGYKPEIRTFLKLQLDASATDSKAVRNRWTYGLNIIGDSYQLKNESKHAQVVYEKILELDPTHTRALTNLGAMKGKQGSYDQAISFFQRAIDANPDYAAAYFNLSIALARIGDEAAAHRAYLQGIQRRGMQN